MVAKMLEKIIPLMGAPFLFDFSNNLGNRLSRAAEAGICPWSNIQPFKAPIVDAMAPKATRYVPVFPHISKAVSAKGAVEFAKVSGGIIPMITIKLRT